MSVLHCDVETRSAVDLKKTGAYVYFDDPTTDLWCACYAFDDGSVETWVPGEPCPDDVRQHIENGGRLVAHNAAFERLCFNKVLGPRHGWPVPDLEQWYCTTAMCLALALPAGLEDACAVVQAPVQKDAKGARTMKQMAKPRRPRKGEPTDKLLWWDDAERLKVLYAYCRKDVEAERALEKRLAPLSEKEQKLWWLDQKINDRGVCVDTQLCHAALAIVGDARERLDREMRDLTDGAVAGTSAVSRLKGWLRDECGFDGEEFMAAAQFDPSWSLDYSLSKDIIAELLTRDDLPPKARRAFELRREGSKTSVSKIDALLNGMQADRRSRGLLQYHAASTGRWGGRRFQPQNIKRPDLKDVDQAIFFVRKGDLDLIETVYGEPLSTIGDCLRGMVCAEEGNDLVTADYSNVEGRVLAWLADEKWKIDAFKAYDAGLGPDLYKLAYSNTFNVSLADVSRQQRQVGKVEELSMGYQGGVGAFLAMAPSYNVKIGEYYDSIRESASQAVFEQAEAAYRQRGASTGVEERTWVAAETVKIGWRAAHPAVQQFWWDMEEAAKQTVDTGEPRQVGRIRFFKQGSFLFMRLPSGRRLAYAFPCIKSAVMPWTDSDGKPARKPVLHFKGVDSMTRQWREQKTYGGSLVENACQAVARDLLAEALPRLEEAGYPTVLTVHDEAMAEVSAGFGSVKEYEEIMSELPVWASGLPLVAEGWRGERYRK